jgi:RNA polymerase subunit RPABC4/transcription elongation factor Spt4
LGIILVFFTGGAVCGRCKKTIHPKATKCPYCQSELKP